MGKNTMIRKAIKGHMAKNPGLERILPHIVDNVGFVFTHDDLADVKEKILSNKVAAPAKAGTIAPDTVSLPPQNTGMGPEKTSFFQALNIPTKISRGTIEILNDVHLITAGERVGASEATLLQMLGIKPFSYGLVIKQVYDNGSIFHPSVLDITSDDIRARFMQGIQNVAAVSLQIGYPNKTSVPHSIVNGFKNLLAIAAATDLTFKEAEALKDILSDPEKAAAMAAVAAAATVPEPVAAATEQTSAVQEEEDESDEDMGLGLFD